MGRKVQKGGGGGMGYIGVILGLYCGVILGLYWDSFGFIVGLYFFLSIRFRVFFCGHAVLKISARSATC